MQPYIKLLLLRVTNIETTIAYEYNVASRVLACELINEHPGYLPIILEM